MNLPQVGVVMPAYNGERYIGRALRSLLREREVALHIVVVDDGSTDRTRGIVRALALEHPEIRLIENEHGGVSKARNTGLAALPEEVSLVTFLDCDDLNPEGRIAHQCAVLASRPEADCVVGRMMVFEEEDEERLAPREGSRTVAVHNVQLGAGLFRRGLLGRVGGLAEDMRYGEDLDFMLRVLESGAEVIRDDRVGVYYRRHIANVTNDSLRSRAGFMDAIRRSLVRRRAGGRVAVDLDDLFSARDEIDRIFISR